ncbi:MAG: PEP-CTERM sorting domain-containing protein [Burkholderiales bacterium]|nr:PEP-CTERM sorting domain-containing protein [Burkholderiales bacterium]
MQVGTWQVILTAASVPEPATPPLVLLACVAVARSRKAASGAAAGRSS